jgi:hypothetical protein
MYGVGGCAIAAKNNFQNISKKIQTNFVAIVKNLVFLNYF